MNRRFARFAAGTVWFIATSSTAREICWIDHVVRTSDGVAVYFSAPTSLQVIVGPKENASAGRYFVQKGIVAREGVESDHLALAAGATVYLSQTPEDVCALEVVDEIDHKGILAKTSNHMPGAAAATTARFIPAL